MIPTKEAQTNPLLCFPGPTGGLEESMLPLRLEKGTNDFSLWIETSIGDTELAQRISRLDPYTYTMEDLRKTIVKIIESGMI